MNRVLAIGGIAALIAIGVSSTAVADGAYHTDHFSLQSVDGEDAPLRSGSVTNIHVNGPQIYAQERYHLNGAEMNTEYVFELNLWISDSTCSEAADAALPVGSFTTNRAGNGHAKSRFTPEDIAKLGLIGTGEHGANWIVYDGGTAVYETACQTVFLD
jgi:hypothetical protein